MAQVGEICPVWIPQKSRCPSLVSCLLSPKLKTPPAHHFSYCFHNVTDAFKRVPWPNLKATPALQPPSTPSSSFKQYQQQLSTFPAVYYVQNRGNQKNEAAFAEEQHNQISFKFTKL
ncbi:hypothetical protein SDJN03_04717, partial [Cucurbita argyrosperma subsp. sororia]